MDHDTADQSSAGPFVTVARAPMPDAIAPDGSQVRLLAAGTRGSMAHFSLAAGECSIAVRHRTVEELWYFVRGDGEIWRKHGEVERVVRVEAGTSISIPTGAAFQFRASADGPLEAVGVTMPAWPGDGEAIRSTGPWTPTVEEGPGLALR